MPFFWLWELFFPPTLGIDSLAFLEDSVRQILVSGHLMGRYDLDE